MVFEQVVTILLGTAAGAALVLYTVKPRQVISPPFGVSTIETIVLTSQSTTDSQTFATAVLATATQSLAAETPAEVGLISPGSVPIIVAEAASTGSSEAPVPRMDLPALPSRSVTLAPRAASAARSHRSPRRSSVSPGTNAKPRAPPGSRAAVRKR